MNNPFLKKRITGYIFCFDDDNFFFFNILHLIDVILVESGIEF